MGFGKFADRFFEPVVPIKSWIERYLLDEERFERIVSELVILLIVKE